MRKTVLLRSGSIASIAFRPVALGSLGMLIAASVFAGTSPARSQVAASPSTDIEFGADPADRRDPRVRFIRQVSGPTPFDDDCGDPNDQGEGTPDFEAEPHLSVNPHDPGHLLATWQQDRYTGIGGARSDVVAVSRNGGMSWSSGRTMQPTVLPGISTCTSGTRFRASDPWGAIGPDGVAYQAAMPVTELASESRLELDFDGDIVVSTSGDGGRTWGAEPAAVAVDDGIYWEEKPVIAADPVDAGRAYVAWARHISPDPGLPFLPADVFMSFSRTEDGGHTWTTPSTIPPNLPEAVDWPFEILAIPSEDETTIVVLFLTAPQRTVFSPSAIWSVRSGDGGGTWSSPSLVAEIVDSAPFPSAGVGPDGEIYVSWFDRKVSQREIRYARSDDLGTNWTEGSVRTLDHPVALDHLLPTIAVAGDGTVGLFWYDNRNDVDADDEVTTDVFFASSVDGGATWREIHLAGPFDLENATVGRRRFLGDYEGLVGFPRGFGALFSMARPQASLGPTDIFYARIDVPPRTGASDERQEEEDG